MLKGIILEEWVPRGKMNNQCCKKILTKLRETIGTVEQWYPSSSEQCACPYRTFCKAVFGQQTHYYTGTFSMITKFCTLWYFFPKMKSAFRKQFWIGLGG